MRSLIVAALLLAGAAHADDAELARLNAEINSRARYTYYEARDFRYLKPGVEGQWANCAAFAWTKFVDLVHAGYSPVIRQCTLETGEPHVFVEVAGMVLLNQRDKIVPVAKLGCQEER